MKNQPTPRRFDTAAIDELVESARGGDVDLDYLIAALEHYRTVYGSLLKEREAIEENARRFNLWRAIEP